MVPAGLRVWFVIHWAADTIVGLPLLLAPETTLGLLGWTPIDPIAARLVGAAQLGIGGESLLGRNAGAETYRALLDLKIIWSSCAVAGLAIGMGQGGPPIGWLFLAVFAGFAAVWILYRLRLR